MNVMGLYLLETVAIWVVFGAAILGLHYAIFLRNQIVREDKGTPKMQEVWSATKDGADAPTLVSSFSGSGQIGMRVAAAAQEVLWRCFAHCRPGRRD